MHGAFTRGYDVTLVADAHTTDDRSSWGAPPPAQVIAHTNLYWSYQSAPGRFADTVLTDNVSFSCGPCWGSVAVEPQPHRHRKMKCTDALGFISFGSAARVF